MTSDPGQAGLADDLCDAELGEERGEEKDAGGGTVETLAGDLRQRDGSGDLGDLCPFDRAADLQSGAAGKAREALLGEDPLDGADADVRAVLGEELGDLAGREVLAAPGADQLANGARDLGPAFLARGLGEVQLAGAEPVPEEVDVARLVAEALGDGAGGEAFDEGGAESFVTPLPVGLGVQEVGGVVHGLLCYMAVTSVTINS